MPEIITTLDYGKITERDFLCLLAAIIVRQYEVDYETAQKAAKILHEEEGYDYIPDKRFIGKVLRKMGAIQEPKVDIPMKYEQSKQSDVKPVSEQEKTILDRIRELEYGAVEVIIKKGNPVFVNTRKEEKLD